MLPGIVRRQDGGDQQQGDAAFPRPDGGTEHAEVEVMPLVGSNVWVADVSVAPARPEKGGGREADDAGERGEGAGPP